MENVCLIEDVRDLLKDPSRREGFAVGSATSQLLYEIQSPLYYNCDVTANLEGIKMEQVGEVVMRLTGVKGLPPVPTTDIGYVRDAPSDFMMGLSSLIVSLDHGARCLPSRTISTWSSGMA